MTQLTQPSRSVGKQRVALVSGCRLCDALRHSIVVGRLAAQAALPFSAMRFKMPASLRAGCRANDKKSVAETPQQVELHEEKIAHVPEVENLCKIRLGVSRTSTKLRQNASIS